MQIFFTSSIPAPDASATPPDSGPRDWPQTPAQAIRDPAELIDDCHVPDELREAAGRGALLFPLLVPRSFLERIRPGDPHDPLLAQVLPLALEEIAFPGFVIDPVGDSAARRAPGLLHKYQG